MIIENTEGLDYSVSVKNLEELTLVKNDDVNISIYNRDLTDKLSLFLDYLIGEKFCSINTSLDIKDFSNYFDTHLKNICANYIEEYNSLKSDIESLLLKFSEISNSNHLKLFFGIIESDMCRRFHIDMYELRMLCTYKGQGTFWVSSNNVNYQALNSGGNNEEIVLRAGQVNQLKETEVAIIKGALYPKCKVGGLVHRSPRIQNLNQKRIVLRVDSNSLLNSINN